MKEKILLTAASCVFKKKKGDISWFLVKNEDSGDWEIPKTQVRTGESSVRASIRSMAEEGGMRAKVIEEVGRAGGAGKVGEKIVTQRTLFYLLSYREGADVLGFVDSDWVDHSSALRKVSSKRDNQMLKDAKVLIGRLEKEQGKAFKTGAAAVAEEQEEEKGSSSSSDDEE